MEGPVSDKEAASLEVPTTPKAEVYPRGCLGRLCKEVKGSPILFIGMTTALVLSVVLLIVFSVLIAGLQGQLSQRQNGTGNTPSTAGVSPTGSVSTTTPSGIVPPPEMVPISSKPRATIEPSIPVEPPKRRLLATAPTSSNSPLGRLLATNTAYGLNEGPITLATNSNTTTNTTKILLATNGVYAYSDGTVAGSCEEYLWANHFAPDGTYRILVANSEYKVLCDMARGGWIVFQRRLDGRQNFQLSWVNYKNGFGNIDWEFWYGLENIRRLLAAQPRQLRLVYRTNGVEGSSQWQWFKIYDESTYYKLELGQYDLIHSTQPFDALSNANGARFSTVEEDHDTHPNNCASSYGGGFWYTNCANTYPNGWYSFSWPGMMINSGSNWLYCTYFSMMMK